MNATRSYVKIYDISPLVAEDFEFDYDTAGADIGSNDLLGELVPDYDNWGGLGWMELSEYEYNSHDEILHLTLETKWLAPTEWLRNASLGTRYFENKLITMATIQKDERRVFGIAIMDGEVLQSKTLFEAEPEEVNKYYNDRQGENDLDIQIWDSISKFVKVCEQFYLEGNKEND